MDKRQESSTTDLLVVGSGIIGLATAFLGIEQGLTVRVIDSENRPIGSSIQNFGHACFTGQADVIQNVASVARNGWQRAAKAAGLWASEVGTYIPATSELEQQVLEEFAAHRGKDQVRLLSREQVGLAIGNPEVDALSGAHLPLDMRVNPREAAPKLAEWLAEQGVDFVWNTQVFAVGDGVASTSRGDYTASHIVAAPGYRLNQVFPELAERHGVRNSALVMSLIERPAHIPADLGMLTGTSMTRYDGFTAMPSGPKLAQELAEREPELVACVANLMVTGIEEGLLIGDSHAYDLSPEPFIGEDIGELLLDRATRILGIDQPRVKQRWLGQYADSRSTNLVLERIDDRTTVAVVTSGIGMTLSFGIADLALNGATVPQF